MRCTTTKSTRTNHFVLDINLFLPNSPVTITLATVLISRLSTTVSCIRRKSVQWTTKFSESSTIHIFVICTPFTALKKQNKIGRTTRRNSSLVYLHNLFRNNHQVVCDMHRTWIALGNRLLYHQLLLLQN